MQDILISDFSNLEFQKAFKQYFQELGVKVTDWKELFCDMNSQKNNYAYVRLENSGEVIGFIQFTVSNLTDWFFSTSYGFIREFWVAKKYRRSGHGKSLLALAEAYYKQNGMQKVILTADTALAFYEKQGYIADNTITAKNKLIVLTKQL